jgi:predicted RNA binding protein YcfA (HicA-like mRNA interferase family)
VASSLCWQGNQTTRGMMHTVLARRDASPIVIPIHRGKTLKEGTARGILKQAGLSEHTFFKVY